MCTTFPHLFFAVSGLQFLFLEDPTVQEVQSGHQPTTNEHQTVESQQKDAKSGKTTSSWWFRPLCLKNMLFKLDHFPK